MNKTQYLEKLQKSLKSLPEEEREDILNDFKEYFEIGIERGRPEEELSIALGNPKTLARQIMLESYIKKAEETKSAAHIIRAIFTSVGLSFFNIIFILPVFLVVFSILVSLFAVSVSLGAAGITGTVGSFFYPLYSQYVAFNVNIASMIFAFIGIGSAGILFFVGNIYLSKLIFRFTVKYLKFNLSVIRGRRSQDEV
ncbi:MAG: DUF1700 domain-containing protein [Actinobacteria bacterium]|nr:DUF1700 domain-containing protein [Actinomycetota bacterium]